MTGIRTTLMKTEQCQKFDGLLTRKSIMSPHGGPAASPANNNCDLHDIPFKSLRQWPQDVALAERRAKTPEVIPINVSAAPASTDSVQLHAAANESITLHLPGGIRMCCHPSQLTDVFRALRYPRHKLTHGPQHRISGVAHLTAKTGAEQSPRGFERCQNLQSTASIPQSVLRHLTRSPESILLSLTQSLLSPQIGSTLCQG